MTWQHEKLATDLRVTACCCVALALTISKVPAAYSQVSHVPSSLHVHVTDSEGAVIGKTLLFIHANAAYDNRSVEWSTLPEDQSVRTDAAGDLSLTLQPAFYNVCAFAGGFAPTCTTLLIEPSKTVDRKIVLKFDEFMCQYFCDTIPTAPSRMKKQE